MSRSHPASQLPRPSPLSPAENRLFLVDPSFLCWHVDAHRARFIKPIPASFRCMRPSARGSSLEVGALCPGLFAVYVILGRGRIVDGSAAESVTD